MTLDESDKQTSDDGQENVDNNENSLKPNSTTIQQDESMQWTGSIRNTADDLLNNNTNDNNQNKAAIKRTFDQISDGSSSSQLIEESNAILDADKILTGDEMNEQNENESVDNNNDKQDETTPSILKEPVTFKVVYAKEIFELTRDENETILVLKNHLQKLTSVNHSSQKLCYKGGN
ncbi:hypothetical protein BLA29_009900 [Euroglyphus maynei]|uniref:Uncharacterized protein n=1 Tax=Euroglyphus maynei TaxID=6958 RepID=A0A1Y3AME4_EURMA|nr:hypothetical protein BLA29_009900 [Euroglyphus maynei]